MQSAPPPGPGEVLEVVEEDQTEENDVGAGDEKEDRMRKRNRTRRKNEGCRAENGGRGLDGLV